MTSTKALIKKEFWWPSMNNDIEQRIRNCEICERPSTAQSMHSWPKAAVWSRLHIDWAYSNKLGEILVIVDPTSGWLEAFPCQSRATSSVINALREVFARFGIPNTLVSDNAKEFKSEELENWCKLTGIKQIFTPEYHPQSNGAAERMVRHIKDSFRTKVILNQSFVSAQINGKERGWQDTS
jgi:hypothetical protein